MTNNIAHPALNDADMINNDIAKARTSFSTSKDEAGRAAAHTYIVWRRALAPTANADTRKWIDKEISNANKRIADAAKAAGEKHGYVQIKAKAGASELLLIDKSGGGPFVFGTLTANDIVTRVIAAGLDPNVLTTGDIA